MNVLSDFRPVTPPELARQYYTEGYWDDRTTLDDLERQVTERPAATAVVDRDRRLSWAELDSLSLRLAGALYDLGVRSGEIVSYQLPNWLEANLIDLACARLGAVSNPILYVFRAHELRWVLSKTGSRVFVLPAEFRGFDYVTLAGDVLSDLTAVEHVFVVGGDPGSYRRFDELLAEPWEEHYPAEHFRPFRPRSDDPAVIMFSSGTTGRPKGIVHSFNTLRYMARSMIRRCELQPANVLLVVGPVGNATGTYPGTYIGTLLGAKVVWLDVWSPEAAMDLIQSEGATYCLGPVSFPLPVIRHPRRSEWDLSTMRVWACGGAPIPRELIGEAAAAGMRLQAIFGSSEAAWYCMHKVDDPPAKLASSDGSPVWGMDVRVVDDDGNDVAPGGIGEAIVRGPMLCLGYFGDDEAVAQAFDAAGYWHSGDLVTMDAEGYVAVVGRKKDMIIRKGMNIYPAEVEDLISRHPAVHQVAVVGVPDPEAGERAVACIVTRESAAALTIEDLRAYLKEQGLASYKLPEAVRVVGALPVGPTGKVLKYRLREELEKEGESG